MDMMKGKKVVQKTRWRRNKAKGFGVELSLFCHGGNEKWRMRHPDVCQGCSGVMRLEVEHECEMINDVSGSDPQVGREEVLDEVMHSSSERWRERRSVLVLTGMVVERKGWVRLGVQERSSEGQMMVEWLQ